MFYLSATALILLLLPKGRNFEIILLLSALLIFIRVQRQRKVTVHLRHPIVSLLSGALLALDFCVTWKTSGTISRISCLVGFGSNEITALISILLFGFSLPMLDALASLLLQGGEATTACAIVPESRPNPSAVFVCAAIALLTALQFSTVPFLNTSTGTDCSVFLYIGQRMHKGFMPYRDIFDHKGPVLYLINWLGLFLHTNSAPYLGVWLLELINMFAFVWGMYKLLATITPPPRK